MRVDSLAGAREMRSQAGLFGFQRGDDFFKTRLSSQRVPKRQQFQLTIADLSRMAHGFGKLFAGQIFLADPRSDHGIIKNHATAIQRIFFHGKKLDRAPTFA